MTTHLLAISIGNTRTRIGTFVDHQLEQTWTHDNDTPERITDQVQQAYRDLGQATDTTVLMASVNPPLSDRVAESVRDRLGLPVQRVERDVPIAIGRQLDHESLVGDDRLLNAAAAYDVLKQACVVVDAGTAVTVDFVDGAGTFHGGAIAPGARMMLDSLHEHTAQLPQVTPAKPVEPIGHNTVEAMRSAVYFGLRGMVHELVDQYAQVAGSYPIVIVTGGDAELLFKDDELIDRVVPDLTLMGMAATLRTALTAEL